MKSKLVLKPHEILETENVIEIWYDGALLGTLVGADGPGVRLLSKHNIGTFNRDSAPPKCPGHTVNVLEVRITH